MYAYQSRSLKTQNLNFGLLFFHIWKLEIRLWALYCSSFGNPQMRSHISQIQELTLPPIKKQKFNSLSLRVILRLE